MLTQEEEQFVKDLYAYHQAVLAYENKVDEYTAFRSQLDDAKDPDIIAKSQSWEDEIAILKSEVEKKTVKGLIQL